MSRVLSRDVRHAPLEPQELDPADVVVGDPRVGLLELASSGGVEVGVWEITHGVVCDTEADELFVVLSGAGDVRFEGGEQVLLAPGVVVRLHAGERTTWTISHRLRKIYVLLPPSAPDGTTEETA